MQRWRIDLGYDGTEFYGWAVQPGRRTVQGELEQALAVVLRREIPLTVAGRTDAGVHAFSQVASFEAEAVEVERTGGCGALAHSLNGLTGWDLAIWGIEQAPEGFDARRSAVSRDYVYRVDRALPPSPFERGRALWWPRAIDRAALESCADALLGLHDFTAFTPTKTEHVHFARRILNAWWEEEVGTGVFESDFPDGHAQPVLAFRIEADAFMRSMVRILVGTMLDVATGQRTLDEFRSLLDGAPRSEAGPTAPAHGLFLKRVRYSGQ